MPDSEEVSTTLYVLLFSQSFLNSFPHTLSFANHSFPLEGLCVLLFILLFIYSRIKKGEGQRGKKMSH
jgi:hypothetical protein